MESMLPDFDSEELEARQAEVELSGLSGEARVEAARRDPRCRTRAFIQLAMSRTGPGAVDPIGWGQAAVAAASSEDRLCCRELLPLAWARLGNALRFKGQLRAALSAFHYAAELEDEIADPLDLAQVWSLRASLHFEMEEHREAADLLRDGLKEVRGLASDSFQSVLEVKLGLALVHLEEFRSAADTLGRASTRLHPVEDLRLFLVAHHNLAYCEVERGHFGQAARILAALEHWYYELDDPKLLVLRDWLFGRILAGRGHLEQAADVFGFLRSRSLELGLVHFAGRMELDRGELLYLLGSSDEAEQSVATAHATLEAAGCQQEALAAILLLRQGLERHKAASELLALFATARRRAQSL
ncbi:MAG: hypothetical protein AAF604_09275 [Acidobacteriota bacterium]